MGIVAGLWEGKTAPERPGCWWERPPDDMRQGQEIQPSPRGPGEQGGATRMATAWVREAESWAVTEFAEAELGDARRTQRVITLATALAQHPEAGLPEACGSRAALKAA